MTTATLPGAQLLRDWADTQPSQQEAARLLRIHPSTLSLILSGRRRPTLNQALAMQALAGVPTTAWQPEA